MKPEFFLDHIFSNMYCFQLFEDIKCLWYENLGNLLISMLNSLCCMKEQDSNLLKQTATLLIHIIGRFKKKAQLRRGWIQEFQMCL